MRAEQDWLWDIHLRQALENSPTDGDASELSEYPLDNLLLQHKNKALCRGLQRDFVREPLWSSSKLIWSKVRLDIGDRVLHRAFLFLRQGIHPWTPFVILQPWVVCQKSNWEYASDLLLFPWTRPRDIHLYGSEDRRVQALEDPEKPILVLSQPGCPIELVLILMSRDCNNVQRESLMSFCAIAIGGRANAQRAMRKDRLCAQCSTHRPQFGRDLNCHRTHPSFLMIWLVWLQRKQCVTLSANEWSTSEKGWMKRRQP